MSVIGIDFGNESCYVAAAKAGGIETLANDYSLRATPSCIAFAGKKRIIGVAAKNQMVTNMKNTIGNIKRLLGRKFNDPLVQAELRTTPYKLEQQSDGGIGIVVNYLDNDYTFTPEQITAMLFTKLRETSVTALQAQVNDCVIACPSYYTNAERKALLDAAHVAGLNVLRLMNETTATALSYGFYKQDLPEPDDKSRNVIFVDCGHASLQVSACAFNKSKLRMIASAFDDIGGRDFDILLADYFSKEFQAKYKIDAKSSTRAYLRLLSEVDKIKKQMSANSTKLPLSIECFMNDLDVTASIQRNDFEDMSLHLIKRIEVTMRKLLKDSKLSLDEIHSVEVVGGSTRIPAIKTLIEQIFGKIASTTLNQDEAVSRGAALQCAIMSPAVRVRDFNVTDIQNFPIKVSWDGEANQTGEMEVYPMFHAAPFSKQLTIFRRAPFNMKVSYAEPNHYPDPFIGCWHIKDPKPNALGESQEIKIKVRIDQHGIVLISNAIMIEKKEAVENDNPVNEQENTTGNKNEQQPDQTNATTGENMETGAEDWNIKKNYGNFFSEDIIINNDEDNVDDDYNDELIKINKNKTEYDNNNSQQTTSSSSSPQASGGPGWAQRLKGWFSSDTEANKKEKEKKKKSANKSVELTMEANTYGFLSSDLVKYTEMECKMIENDHQEKERVDARNALEEYVYDMRDKLQEDGILATYITVDERESLCNELNDLENWLYEDGENCEKDLYRTKLTNLHSKTDPIKIRCTEYETQPSALDELGRAIQLARKSVDEYRKGEVKYNHLTETEILNISEAADKANKWLDETRGKLMNTAKTVDPPIKISDIRHEWQTLSTCVNSVLSRPKPKPQPPPTSTPSTGSGGASNKTNKNESNGDNNDNVKGSAPTADGQSNDLIDDTMDIE